MKDLNTAKQTLASGTYTCVLCRDEEIYTSQARGVKPLVAWYTDSREYKAFAAADKVVGRGAAFLYVLLEVKAVYAGVISSSALEVLKNNGIYVEYTDLVDNIINRKGDGICPFEGAVLHISDKNEAYTAIRKRMEELDIRL